MTRSVELSGPVGRGQVQAHHPRAQFARSASALPSPHRSSSVLRAWVRLSALERWRGNPIGFGVPFTIGYSRCQRMRSRWRLGCPSGTSVAATGRRSTALGLGVFCAVSCASGAEPARSNGPSDDCSQVQTAEPNPLHEPGGVTAVAVVYTNTRPGRPLERRPEGAVLRVRPARGLTAEWLTHILHCDAATPHPAGSQCPLAVPGARLTVAPVGEFIAVWVRSDQPKQAEEIIRRANLLER